MVEDQAIAERRLRQIERDVFRTRSGKAHTSGPKRRPITRRDRALFKIDSHVGKPAHSFRSCHARVVPEQTQPSPPVLRRKALPELVRFPFNLTTELVAATRTSNSPANST